MSEDRLSGMSDALLPGAGHTPGYGITDDYETNLVSSHVLTDSTRTKSSGTTVRTATLSSIADKEKVWVVARCALIACLASFVSGMNGGFSSPTLQELDNPNTTIPVQLFQSSKLSSLFGSLTTVGGMFGGLFAFPISELLGRQATLMLGGVPFLTGWVLIANAIQITQNRAGFLGVLFTGRFLTGFATGWSVFSASVYIAEISSPKWMGRFGVCNQLFITLGTLLVYFFGINFRGKVIHYYYTALVAAGVVALFEVMMLMTYETPRWLFKKNMDYMGIRVLKILRGQQFHIMKEIDGIKTAIRHTYSAKEQLLEFRRRVVLHPFILVLFLMFFQQFSGINAAIFYASKIFTQVGYGVDSSNLIAFFAVGVVQVVATFISVLLINYFGRRKLLITSSIGMVASSFLLGIYFYIYSHTCHKVLSSTSCPHGIEYMAILSVVLFISSFSLGWGPIPWSSMSELLPNRVRTLGGSMATFVNWGFATIITLEFEPYSQFVSPEGTWWTFSLIMMCSILFVAFFLPETGGRTLEQIQKHFETGQIVVCCRGLESIQQEVVESSRSFISSRQPSTSVN